jgi:Uma2 family endonuclease
MPAGTRAELIGGIVFMPSPVKADHGQANGRMLQLFFDYQDATAGTKAFDNATTILGEESEPQPDASLLVLPDYGGQTHNKDGYIVGAPELASEVAYSTVAIDLHRKLRDYEKAGIKEYVVIVLGQEKVHWFVRREGRFVALTPGLDGILRSEVFPGFWLDPLALLKENGKQLKRVLRKGLRSSEHAAFVTKLAAQKKALNHKKATTKGKKSPGSR